MFYKARLTIGGEVYEMTDADLKNWDEMEIALKRSSFDGVMRSFANSFEFVNTACKKLYAHFIKKGFSFDVKLKIFLRNSEWEWKELYSCVLDASTIKFDGYVFSVSAMSGDVATVLAAKKSTKYELDVAGLEKKALWFNRIEMNNWQKMILDVHPLEIGGLNFGDSVKINGLDGEYKLPVYWSENSIRIPGAVEFHDQQSEKIQKNADGILTAKNNVSVRLRFSIKLGVITKYIISGRYSLALRKYSMTTGQFSDIKRTYVEEVTPGQTGWLSMDVDTNVELKKGDEIYAVIDVPRIQNFGTSQDSIEIPVDSYRGSETDCTMKVDWQDVGPAVSFDCVKPVVLLQEVLDSMKEGLTAVIDDSEDNRLKNCALAAAESIRGLDEAKIYTSFADFCKFMECVFGYVYEVDGNNVIFRHRDKVFTDNVALDLEQFNNVSISAVDKNLHSAIEIGMPAVDYDEDNGRKESCFKHVYSTGNAFSDNTLSLEPAYRLDPFGIEYLVESREDDTKDKKDDKGVFAILTTENVLDGSLSPDTTIQAYEEIKHGVVNLGEYSERKVIRGYFNALYHPYYCALANSKYLATFAGKMTFASSEGNSSVIMGGVRVSSDIDLRNGKKYAPMEISFESADTSLMNVGNGKVSLTDGGRTYTGWLSSLGVNPTREKVLSATLIADSNYFAQEAVTPPSATPEGKVIYVRAGLAVSADKRQAVEVVLDKASDYDIQVRVRYNILNLSGDVVEDYVYELMSIGANTTSKTFGSFDGVEITEVRVFQKNTDHNTYVSTYVNRDLVSGEDLSRYPINMGVFSTYSSRDRKSTIKVQFSEMLPEPLSVTVAPIINDVVQSAHTFEFAVGDTYKTFEVEGDVMKINIPLVFGADRCTVNYTGFTYEYVSTTIAPPLPPSGGGTSGDNGETVIEKPVITEVIVDDIKGDGSNSVSSAEVKYTQILGKYTKLGTQYVTFDSVTSGVGTSERRLVATRQITVTDNGMESDPYTVSIYQEPHISATLNVVIANQGLEDKEVSITIDGQTFTDMVGRGDTTFLIDGAEIVGAEVSISGIVMPSLGSVDYEMSQGEVVEFRSRGKRFDFTLAPVAGRLNILTLTIS